MKASHKNKAKTLLLGVSEILLAAYALSFTNFLRTLILKIICERLLISIQSTKPSTSLTVRRGLQLCNCFIYSLKQEEE